MSSTFQPAGLIDAHAHIDQHEPRELPGIIERARAAGVTGIIVAGVTAESSRRCARLAQEHEGYLWAGVGIHPMEVTGPLSESEAAELTALARSPGVVCISEIGLDHQPGQPAHGDQEQAFRVQLRIAAELRLPVIFHNRDAGLRPLEIMRDETGNRVGLVAHYFQGTRAYAYACLDQGILLSLAKPLLRLPELQEVVRRDVPLDRIVLETDSYPQPFKKRRESWTEPWHLPQVAAKVAELKGISTEEVAATTSANLKRLLSPHHTPTP